MTTLDPFSKQVWEALESAEGPQECAEEVEFAYASVPATPRQVEAEAPLPPQITELPKMAVVDPVRAKTFLEQSLPWGESTKELMLYLHDKASDTPFSVIRYHCVDHLVEHPPVTGNPRTNVSALDLQKALDQAVAAGLVIAGYSRGYREYGSTPEALQQVFVFNRAPAAEEILYSDGDIEVESSVEFNAQASHELLTQSPFFRDPRITFKPELSAKEFFDFLEKPRNLTEIMQNPNFYPNSKESFSPRVREFVEGVLAYAEQIGMVQAIGAEGQPKKFVLVKAARESLAA